jgi:ATP-dependent Clp protease ATP-binding subunit ClpB
MTEANQTQIYETTRTDIIQLMRRTLRPEFLNRIDEILVFKPLTKEHIREIVDILFQRHVRSALLRQGMDAELTEAAKQHFSDEGNDPVFGARPLKRLMQKELTNEISTQILEGTFAKGDKIEIDFKQDRLILKKKNNSESD